MQKELSFLLIVLAVSVPLTSAGSFSAQSCHWTDDKNNEYDLSYLKKGESWKVKDMTSDSGLFSMDYLFSFCENTPIKCKNMDVGAYEALEVLGQLTETCEILGRFDQQAVVPLDNIDPDKGLRITYSGGDICSNSEKPIENNFPRKINFNVYCSDYQDDNFKQSRINSDTITKCNMEFTINSPAGCRMGWGRGGKRSTVILLWILVIMVVYFAGGYIWNQKKYGKQGTEAIPHLTFWTGLPSLAAEGMRFTGEKAKQGIGHLREKISGHSTGPGYSVV